MNKNTQRQHILRTQSWIQKKKQLETVDSMEFILAKVATEKSRMESGAKTIEEKASLQEDSTSDTNPPDLTTAGTSQT